MSKEAAYLKLHSNHLIILQEMQKPQIGMVQVNSSVQCLQLEITGQRYCMRYTTECDYLLCAYNILGTSVLCIVQLVIICGM